ncbi:MAG: hypothetical protein ACK53Y_19270, partial [bacterium]
LRIISGTEPREIGMTAMCPTPPGSRPVLRKPIKISSSPVREARSRTTSRAAICPRWRASPSTPRPEPTRWRPMPGLRERAAAQP